jgi:hypothetical protein
VASGVSVAVNEGLNCGSPAMEAFLLDDLLSVASGAKAAKTRLL